MSFLHSAAGLLSALFLIAPLSAQVVEPVIVEHVQEVLQPQQSEDWNLLLVNRWNPMPENYEVELKLLSQGVYVDVRIYNDLRAMLAACRKDGLNPLVCSGYRSVETQTRLHNNKIARLLAEGYSQENAKEEARRWVAVPGTSEHHTGMAVDIVAVSYQKLTEQQEKTAEQKWLMEHCWEYGFILRYPTEKSEITGIGYEPWHYRYVGREAAMAMRDSGLCLEEYMRLLQAEESVLITEETAQETGS